MDQSLTEDHLKALLNKEWLVKVDAQTSVPYLFKFISLSVDLSCCILLTDAKTVWSEVLNTEQFSRRWRACNADSPEPYHDEEEEDAWREANLELLSDVHSLGGITEVAFEVVQSRFSDLAVELECEGCKWRWESNSVGYRSSAEIISKHLIFPLISANHLGFSSADPLSAMSDEDVEKAVDRLAKTGRRAVGNHVKNAFSKPKLATTLRRITAMFNFATELQPVSSVAQKPRLESKQVKRQPPPQAPRSPSPLITQEPPKNPATKGKGRLISESPPRVPSQPRSGKKVKSAVPTGSETEDSDAEEARALPAPETWGEIPIVDARMGSPSPSPAKPSPPPPPSIRDSPVPKSVKKPRLNSSTDSGSDSGSKAKSGSRAPVKRGTKQPVKRGGKRF